MEEVNRLSVICPYMGRKEKDQRIVIPGEFEYIPFTIKPNTVFLH
jgi:hypothetical protein